MIDLIGIGEALIEFAEVSPGEFRQSFAGDVINTLYYASKLGLHTSFFSSLGSDSFTDDLTNFFDTASIDHSNCPIIKNKNNGLYIIRTDSTGEPHFTFFRNTSAAREAFNEERVLPPSRAVIFSAIGLAIVHNSDNLFKALEKATANSLIYFDLNVRESLWRDKSDLVAFLPRLASLVTVLSLSRADDQTLFGKREAEAILSHYESLGFTHFILRDGSNNIVVSKNGEHIPVAVEEAKKVVDATGAGDAFNAGYIYGMLNDLDVARSAQIGNKAAREVLIDRGGIVSSFSAERVLEERTDSHG